MKCPGQDMQYWNEDAIYEVSCPKCHAPVEFYKDDTNRRCQQCGHRFVNPKMDFGCAAYCQYAEQCLGTLPEEFAGAQDALLKDKVAVEVKRYLKTDFHRIGHAARVARYAETLGKSAGANIAVLLCAAYLRDIGNDLSADCDHATSKIASDILTKLKTKEAMLEAVCSLLDRSKPVDKSLILERKLLEDAARLAEFEENSKQENFATPEDVEQAIAGFNTMDARNLAQRLVTNISA